MKYSFDVKISEHIWEDSLGQLVCLEAIIAREGFQEYYEDDILKNGSFKIVKVERPWEEVLKSAPTFEAKPIVIQHPDKDIDISVKNMKDFKVGHMQNVRPSEHEGVKVLIADLVFDNEEAIKKVKSGELRELSCGYFYEIDPKEMKQYDIKGEHLALVNEGRAGIAKIIDGKEEIFDLHRYLTLDSKEAKDQFMAKISSKVLEAIKDYYVRNEESMFSEEEVDLTIKIVERELNKRNHYNMGLQENAEEPVKALDDSDILSGGLSDGKSVRDLAIRHDVSEKTIRRELQKGIKIEMEHTDDERIAKEIAKDHLFEDYNYYTKLKHFEEDKIEDRYIEDEDKITMQFNEDELAWSSTKASSLKQGDIISTVGSIRPFEIQSIKKVSGGDLLLYLISTDESFKKSLKISQEGVLDVLVEAESGKKIRFDQEEKATDESKKTTIKDLEVGDVVLLGNKKFLVTNIEQVGKFYDVYHYGNLIYSGAEGNVEVTKE